MENYQNGQSCTADGIIEGVDISINNYDEIKETIVKLNRDKILSEYRNPNDWVIKSLTRI